jgi:sigma-B regulation protein RsbU (phosphoserine phosphatase)
MFVTIFCVMLDLETGELEFANGGHNPPLVCIDKGRFDFIDVPKGFVVGAMENSKCGSGKIVMKPNDVIFLYTDGVTEAMNEQNELFSEEKLKSCLVPLKDKDVVEIVKGVREEMKQYTQNAAQSDDITMLVLKYKGNLAHSAG